MLELLFPLVLLASGLAAGVMMWTQLGGWPLLASLPDDRYVYTHAFFATRYDPFMPACLLITAIGSGLLALLAPGPGIAALFLLSCVLTVTSIVISIVKNVPVNRWVRSLDPDQLPGDFASQDPRRSWGAWNRARAILAVTAFVANCAAVFLLL